MRNLERTEGKPEGRELVLMPQGPQGPILGFRVVGSDEVRRFNEAMSGISEENRKDVSTILDVARKVGLERVD